MEKSPEEIATIQRATDASIDAHRAAWRMIHPGDYEYQVAATMVGTYENEGCQRSAYAPIVGSGPNSAVLHYSRNSRRMDAGEVVVMDVGAECDNYASDITRTVPAGGKFTPRQREIYDVVLGAQRAAIAAVKPGMTLGKRRPTAFIRSPTITSTRTARTCTASRWASTSRTAFRIMWDWMCTMHRMRESR